MVTGIHFVEAYLLNPAIYSAHLKLHPLLVISTLVVAEHSLGVWGLLLAGERELHDNSHVCMCSISVYDNLLRTLHNNRIWVESAAWVHGVHCFLTAGMPEIVYVSAVPLTVFALDYCIRFPAESMKDVAARELEIVSVDIGDM